MQPIRLRDRLKKRRRERKLRKDRVRKQEMGKIREKSSSSLFAFFERIFK